MCLSQVQQIHGYPVFAWLAGLCALELEIYQLFSLSIARMACHPSNSAKSWLFTIYMGKPVGSRFG